MKFRAFGYSLLGLSLAFAAQAADPPADAGATAPAVAPAEAPSEATPPSAAATPATAPAEAAAAAPAAEAAPRHRVTLGPVGRDANGREGRIHTVERGDTLWDVSDAYLGTPWVWPSLWSDNRAEIENPHLIHPGDKLWVSPWEMRPITDEEAKRLMANAGSTPPASLEDADARAARRVKFSSAEAAGFVVTDEMMGDGAVVKLPDGKTMAVQEDLVSIDVGAEKLRPGDQVSFFRATKPVLDPSTNKRIGSFVDNLGWGTVVDANAQSARVHVQHAFSEIQGGDRCMRREIATTDIPVRRAAPGIEGRVVLLPNLRTALGAQDVAYLDQGVRGGLNVGSELEIYRPGGRAESEKNRRGVELADAVIGRMLVVSVQDQSAVALVTRTNTELVRGDRYRTPTTKD